MKHAFTLRASLQSVIALLTISCIGTSLVLRFFVSTSPFVFNLPLLLCLIGGGIPLLHGLLQKIKRKEFGSDLLAGISIITSVILGEYLAGSLVVLMLSGGEALENYAVRRASSVLALLAKRMPAIAHRKRNGEVSDCTLSEVNIGDLLVIYPHEISPVDGIVREGRGVMDESYLTGEPFEISKAPGSTVLSGAINGDAALTIEAIRRAVDSRYAKIMEIMHRAESNRPPIRRLGDLLGAWYTPFSLLVALSAWTLSGSATQFLAVLVVATPCPLIIAIPVAVIGSISLAARRGIIVKDPAVLETVNNCKTIILDKTGTLTYGEPTLSEELTPPDVDKREILRLVASIEKYSKHPLAQAVVRQATKHGLHLEAPTEVSEPPGQGLQAKVGGKHLQITNRKRILQSGAATELELPPIGPGLECVIALDGRYVATYRFHDAPRKESAPFITHLARKHRFEKVMLVSGDRESEVQYLADLVGIKEVYAGKSPEEKVAIVQKENRRGKTIFVGDGINDAPALMTATVGIAFGQNSDITSESAGAVILDTSLTRVDEFFHISNRMRTIALQSAIGGMTVSILGMFFAAFGFLSPVGGAVFQEVIDVLTILNALRAALPPRALTDF